MSILDNTTELKTTKSNITDDSSDEEEVQQFDSIAELVEQNIVMVLQKDTGTCVDTEWSDAKEYDEVTLWKGKVTDSQWNCLRARTTIHVKPKLIADLLTDPNRMVQYDDMVESCRIIQSFAKDDSVSIRHVIAKGIFPTEPRDFVVLTSRHDLDDGSIVICTRSIESDRVPEKKGYVRASINISGYIIRRISSEESEVTVVVHTDLGGYIPPPLINALSTSAPVKLMRNVKRLAELQH